MRRLNPKVSFVRQGDVTLYRGLVAAAVLGGAFLTYRLPNGPLLFWWLFSALAFGTWVSFSPKVTGIRPRAQRLVLLYCVLVSAALISTQLAARRLTSAKHVRFEGVLFERADSVVIASGESGVDVILPTVSPAQTPWRLTLARDAAGWRFRGGASVELVRVSPAMGAPLGTAAELLRVSTRAERHTVLNGVVLDGPEDVAVVRGPDGSALDTLSVVPAEGGVALRSARGLYALEPAAARLRARYRRMLRFGTPLGSLDGQRSAAAAFDRFVRVQRLSVREEVNGNVAGWLDWLSGGSPVSALLPAATTRLLVTAAAPFAVDGGAPSDVASQALPDSVRVEVRHLGGTWRFDLVQMRREPTADRGLSVRFVRNPRPLDSPLPSGDSCTQGVACGLLSLRRLPTPVSHIALDGAGLDPSRFALIARLVDSPGGVRVVLPQGSVTVPLGGSSDAGPTAVPVTDLTRIGEPDPGPTEPRARGPWLLLSASSNYVDDAGVLLLVCLGVTALLFLTAQLVGASADAGASAATPRERFLALGLNAILALLLTRLIIGARLTFFEPFLSAGLDTAIGLWVAVSVVTLGLLSWSAWAPRLLKWGRALDLQGRLRWRASWRRHAPRSRRARTLGRLVASGARSFSSSHWRFSVGYRFRRPPSGSSAAWPFSPPGSRSRGPRLSPAGPSTPSRRGPSRSSNTRETAAAPRRKRGVGSPRVTCCCCPCSGRDGLAAGLGCGGCVRPLRREACEGFTRKACAGVLPPRARRSRSGDHRSGRLHVRPRRARGLE